MADSGDDYENISIADMNLVKSKASEYSEIEGSCLYAHLSSEFNGLIGTHNLEEQRFKIHGAVFLLLTKGCLHIEINTRHIDITAPAAVSLNYGSLVQLYPANENAGVDCYMLMYSPSFLRDVNISFSAISGEAFIEHDDPVMKLSDREITQLLRYYSLIHSVMSDNFNVQLNRHIVSSLTTAIFYQITNFLYKRIETSRIDGTGSRRSTYVEDFLRLVHVHYMKERSVSFYASQLYISPKYLSLLVKEMTGRTAARWIDFFVIMEAKNLLRYSGKNVQQVAYALNFTNQSSFGKYFKHLTGMSPTEYQKS